MAGHAVAFGAEATDGDDGAAVRGAVGAVVPGGVGLAADGALERRVLLLAARVVAVAALLRGARVLGVVLEVLEVVVRARRLGRARARPRRRRDRLCRGRGGAARGGLVAAEQVQGHSLGERLEAHVLAVGMPVAVGEVRVDDAHRRSSPPPWARPCRAPRRAVSARAG